MKQHLQFQVYFKFNFLENGEIYAFGYNGSGEFGNNLKNNSNKAIEIKELKNKLIHVGGHHNICLGINKIFNR